MLVLERFKPSKFIFHFKKKKQKLEKEKIETKISRKNEIRKISTGQYN